MRSIEEKGCYNNGPVQENISSSSGLSFEFHKGNNGANRTSHRNHHHHHRTALGKSTPSKWDDAQKWLVGLSRGGEKNQSSKTKPRNSNADDLRLISPVPQKELENSSSEDEDEGEQEVGIGCSSSVKMAQQYDVETKKVDGNYESVWRINKPVENSTTVVRSICVRDMGTEMTPIASQEPSRTATPLRATTPVARSPISSGSSTPARCQHRMPANIEGQHTCPQSSDGRGEANPSGRGSGSTRRYIEESNDCKNKPDQNQNSDQDGTLNPLETQAVAWDEAERAKYMARYKHEEVKIQAWENHEKRKAEMEMRKMEVKAERIKARAQERLANKLASTRRIAEEKRANAEAKLNEKAVRTSERADYIRRTGHLPSSFSFKLPSLCW
ncbi:Remorin, C-terminal [Parasponia andersonii]|uniref:Remorin, C-terminal n=1 Tax=Parasponia andersonii TaxID=3476 RepID=A0A2P5CUR7_PARAD|nr:Remorin, C-terminal [Parasponia andersonii]